MSVYLSLNNIYLKKVENRLYEKYEKGIIKTPEELQSLLDEAYKNIILEPFK